MLRERILVVDDDESVRELVCSLLERIGFSTTPANGAEEALTRLQEGPAYDLVVSDVMMPMMDGLTLLQHICADHPGTPMVMISAVQDTQIVVHAFRTGAVDYLTKPFSRAELEAVVTSAMERRRTTTRNAEYRVNLEETVSARTARLRATMLELERSYDTTLEAMGNALDLRDEETEGHSKRVTAYTIELGRAIGLSSDELRVFARGALLHDLGKIATPDAILLKQGRLNDDEMAVMRRHCVQGYEIVCKIPFLREAAEIVLTHHERFDGKGYPQGLHGEAIPLGSRIFAVADALDAMTSDRPYRKGTSFEAASAEISRCAGSQFDPRIVEVFQTIPLSTWSQLRRELKELSPTALSAMLCRPTLALSPLER